MAFLKNLFAKKVCDLCGDEIGLLGNRKLEDGNCCKNCANKLSRWFDDRRHATVEQIREQLTYRAENEEALKEFQATKVIGEENLVYIDEKSRRFFVTRYQDYMAENSDILSFDQVLSCELDIDEDKDEIMREVTDKDGNTKRVSYTPRRFLHQYNFSMIIRVRHPFFDDMRFRLNDQTLEIETTDLRSNNGFVNFSNHGIDPTRDVTYRRFVSMGDQIVQILTSAEAAPEEPVAAPPAQPAPKFCTNCGAPFEGGKFCQHCGSKL